MSKGKKPASKSTVKKTATKEGAAREAVAPKKSVAGKISAAAAVAAAPSAPLRTAPPAAPELYDEIRRRAYEFYRARGGEHGSHEADWHRAESEVRSKYK